MSLANGEMTEKRTNGSAEEETVSALYALPLVIKAPGRVQSARLDMLAGNVEIAVEWDATAPVCCSECGLECPRHNRALERTWRHLDVSHVLDDHSRTGGAQPLCRARRFSDPLDLPLGRRLRLPFRRPEGVLTRGTRWKTAIRQAAQAILPPRRQKAKSISS